MIAEDKEKEAGADGAVEKKYPYPKSVLFIISTEFCERFSFYGMKSKSWTVAALSMCPINKILSQLHCKPIPCTYYRELPVY